MSKNLGRTLILSFPLLLFFFLTSLSHLCVKRGSWKENNYKLQLCKHHPYSSTCWLFTWKCQAKYEICNWRNGTTWAPLPLPTLFVHMCVCVWIKTVNVYSIWKALFTFLFFNPSLVSLFISGKLVTLAFHRLYEVQTCFKISTFIKKYLKRIQKLDMNLSKRNRTST